MFFKHQIRTTLDMKLPPKIVFPVNCTTVEDRLLYIRVRNAVRDDERIRFQLPTGSPFSKTIHPCQYKFIFRQLYFVTYEDDLKHPEHEMIRQLATRKLNKKHYNDHRHQSCVRVMAQRIVEGFYHQGRALSWWPVIYVNNNEIDRDFVTDLLYGAMGPARMNPEWKTSTVVSLLRGMRESEDFGPMPLVADALSDAGCDDERLLSRLRERSAFSLGDWLFKVTGLVG